MGKIIELLFPNCCGLCGKINPYVICSHCRYYLKQKEKICIQKVQNPKFYFDLQIALFQYEGIIREKILQYKFSEQAYFYQFFSEILLNHKKIVGFLKSYDIIIPVPIDKKRKRERGYNQSELMAKEITKSIKNLQCQTDNLLKTKTTKPQSTLNKNERKENVKNVYQIKKGDTLKNKRVVLLDDIYTTGSTVNECSKVLKKAGVQNVLVLTIAKD